MIIKLLCRYSKTPNREEDEELNNELNIQALIQGENFDKDKERDKILKGRGNKAPVYDYGPFIFDLKDVKQFNYVDRNHTCIRFYEGDTYTFKIQPQQFESIYSTVTGNVIMDLTRIDNLQALQQTNGQYKD